jgi:hypothetical protein
MRQCAAALAGEASFSVRFHPRESEAYRQRFTAGLGALCSIDPAASAIEAAARADIIIGAYSMLMFDAQAAGIATVFLDVGEDPLGFYDERRRPLADSPETLAAHTRRCMSAPGAVAPSGAANPEAWVQQILAWIYRTSTAPRR